MKKFLIMLHRGFISVIFTAAGVLSLCAGVLGLIGDEVNKGLAGCSLGVILLLAATIDRFELLKALGIEARTKKLDLKIEEAEKAIDRIHRVSELIGENFLVAYCSVGRLPPVPTVMESHAAAQRVKAMLQESGSKPSAIYKAMLPWLRIAGQDVYRHISAPLNELLQIKANQVGVRAETIQDVSLAGSLYQNSALMREYVEQSWAGFRTWDPQDVGSKLIQLLESAPGIEEIEKIRLRPEFETARIELDFLAQNIEFKTISFWSAIKYLPPAYNKPSSGPGQVNCRKSAVPYGRARGGVGRRRAPRRGGRRP
ncbi:hypothetical protein [Acidovorax sacchari]|uniref:hypothetical protein n=1 Tax=Acidovorax sacchari TaxID=3230736 RepID=UPI0039E4EEB1